MPASLHASISLTEIITAKKKRNEKLFESRLHTWELRAFNNENKKSDIKSKKNWIKRSNFYWKISFSPVRLRTLSGRAHMKLFQKVIMKKKANWIKIVLIAFFSTLSPRLRSIKLRLFIFFREIDVLLLLCSSLSPVKATNSSRKSFS